MCPEFERVERIVQIMVDGNEKVQKDLYLYVERPRANRKGLGDYHFRRKGTM